MLGADAPTLLARRPANVSSPNRSSCASVATSRSPHWNRAADGFGFGRADARRTVRGVVEDPRCRPTFPPSTRRPRPSSEGPAARRTGFTRSATCFAPCPSTREPSTSKPTSGLASRRSPRSSRAQRREVLAPRPRRRSAPKERPRSLSSDLRTRGSRPCTPASRAPTPSADRTRSPPGSRSPGCCLTRTWPSS